MMVFYWVSISDLTMRFWGGLTTSWGFHHVVVSLYSIPPLWRWGRSSTHLIWSKPTIVSKLHSLIKCYWVFSSTTDYRILREAEVRSAHNAVSQMPVLGNPWLQNFAPWLHPQRQRVVWCQCFLVSISSGIPKVCLEAFGHECNICETRCSHQDIGSAGMEL